MNFTGFFNKIANDPNLRAALQAQGVNVDPAYQQPAGPNSVTPQTNNAMMNAGIQAGLDYTPAGGGSGGGLSGTLRSAVELANAAAAANQVPLGGGGAPGLPGGGGGMVAPNRDPSALMTPRATVDRFPFSSSVVPGSLGEVFQQMASGARPELDALRQQVQPAAQAQPMPQVMEQQMVPAPRPMNQFGSYDAMPAPQMQQSNTALGRFLSGRRSGGISDLLAARMGM